MNDPDYLPAYQDEYQRLWHEAAARAEAAEREVERLTAERDADDADAENATAYWGGLVTELRSQIAAQAELLAAARGALEELLDSDGHRAGRQLQARRQAKDALARFAALQPENTEEER